MEGFVFILAIALLWFLPLIIIITDNKTSGNEKFAWLLAVIFISWFAWIFYLLLAPLKLGNS